MERVVYKYEIPIDDAWHGLALPESAQILHAACQHPYAVAVWAQVDPAEQDTRVHRLRIFGTGQPIPSGAQWIATTLAGPLVWHLYEFTGDADPIINAKGD